MTLMNLSTHTTAASISSRRFALLVEDSPVNRALLKYILTNESFDVVIATNGQEAVDEFKKQSFDLVVIQTACRSLHRKRASCLLRLACIVRSLYRTHFILASQDPSRKAQTTAAGAVSLQLLGHHEDESIPDALDYSSTLPVEWGNGGGIDYYYYFHYYAIQANYQAGSKYWADWHPRVREMFLDKQNANANWDVPVLLQGTIPCRRR